MKKYLYVFSVLLFGNLFAQPAISVEKPSFDFGVIHEGENVTHSYEIINTGNSDLKITRVYASCGCTAVEPEKDLLKPGEKTSVMIEFNSIGRLGAQEKYIFINSNDPKQKELRLHFKADVQPKVEEVNNTESKLTLTKNYFDFGNIKEGKIVEVTIAFKNSGKKDLIIKDVKTSCGCTAVLLSSKKLKPGEQGDMRIELDTSNRTGKLTRTVTLYSNDPVDPSQAITIFANITENK
ncbi:hypothetical protein APF79_10450 [bacterium BRH_c32]|nr:MAG: hypothetical protein APF79_10450 [bacterium BRH_c32]